MNQQASNSIHTIGIVGAGAMGSGIAQVAATGGLEVRLYDARSGAATDACVAIVQRLQKRAEAGKLDRSVPGEVKARLQAVATLADLASCDLIVEAIVEDLEAKRNLFRELEALVGPETILASNTSSIPIGALAAACQHKSRVAGLHFFNPVPLMKLVEVIPGPDTLAQVVDSLVEAGKRMGRVPVRVRDTPGFLVNFGGRAYPTEGLAILQEGVATPAQIDAIMRDMHGFRMGPFELMDLTGIDVNYPVTRFIHECFAYEPRLRSTTLHRYMLETKQLGRKTGKGFFDYAEGSPQPAVDTVTAAPAAASVFVPCEDDVLNALVAETGAKRLAEDDGSSPMLVSLRGEDCSAYAARLGLDHRRLVAVDTLGNTSIRLTLMCPPGVSAAARDSVIALLQPIRKLTLIEDSPGFVGQRIIAMVANLGCEMAQMRIASVEDIDCAMRLGLNYPKGPIEIADAIGCGTLHDVLCRLQSLTGDDRYRPSPWLRRRAQLGLPASLV